MEGVLHDFTEDVGDGLLNLLADAFLNVNFGVVDLGEALVAGLLEDHAVGFLIQVEHIVGADAVGVAGANGVHAFFGDIASAARAVIDEARCLTDRLLLDIKLRANEVTTD